MADGDVTQSHYDVIVVGAGVIGSSTAYSLAKDGMNTLLLEQFLLPHTRGSSHGHTRLTRKAYPRHHSYYTNMMHESLQLYRQLEQEAGVTLLRDVGVLSVFFDPKVTKPVEAAMRLADIPYRKLDRKALATEYPMLQSPESSEALFEPDAGYVYADRTVASLQKVFVENGGVIHDGEMVIDVIPGNHVTIQTSKRRYTCGKVVLTAGPWAPKLLKPLGVHVPLQPQRISVLYWKEKTPGMFSSERFPCLRYVGVIDGKHNIYGTPADEYPGLIKLCVHTGVDCDPEERDTNTSDPDVKSMCNFIAKHVPQLESKPHIVERCFYTWTPDTDYVMDRHPRWSNIIIGAGFSGHGFKLAPLCGRILGLLACEKSCDNYEMDKFSIARFTKTKHANSHL